MERAKTILNTSQIWRALMALSLWCGGQWRSSGVVQWFLHPSGRGRAAAESSVFYRLWTGLRDKLCQLYEKLGLERLFAGSIFGKTWSWCILPAALAPLIPTMAVLALSAAGFGAMLLAMMRDRSRVAPWDPIGRYVIMYAAVYLTATFCSVDRSSSLFPGMLTVAFILFSLTLYSAIIHRSQMDAAITLLVLAAAAVSAYGILQYIFRWGYQSANWVDSDMFSSISFRATSTLENPNMLGQYLLLTIPLGGAKLMSARNGRTRMFYLACCGLMCVCILLTFARGAWLGLLFAGAVFFVMLDARLLLLAPAVLVVLWVALPPTVLSRFASIGDLGDASSNYRVYIWLATIDMLRDYWLCGVGPGVTAFGKVYPKYSFSAVVAPHSHNLYLQIMCDGGIAALLVFLLLLFVFFRTMASAVSREKDKTSRLYQIAFISGPSGFLLQAMTDYSFYNYRVLFLFWACLALGIASTRRSQMSEGRLMV